MTLPLLKRVADDSVTFVMTPRARRAAGRVRRRIALVDGDAGGRSLARPADAVPRARSRRAVPLSLRHAPLHRLQVLRRRVQRAERQPGRDQLAPRRRDRRRLVSECAAGLSLDGLQSLRQPDLSQRLSGRRLHQGSGHRHRAPQRRRVHRLPVLHVELLVRRPAVQPRARRRRQMRHVPRTPRARPGAGLRQRVPGRRHPDRDHQDRRVARRRGGERRWRGRAGRRRESLDDAGHDARAPAAGRAAGRGHARHARHTRTGRW